MNASARPRFTLRDLMVLVILIGIFLAGECPRGRFDQPDSIFTLGSTIVHCGGLGVYYLYRGLSRWIWLLIATQLVPPFGKLVGLGDWFMRVFPLNGWPSATSLIVVLGLSVLYYLAIGMTFHAISRRLLAAGALTGDRSNGSTVARDDRIIAAL